MKHNEPARSGNSAGAWRMRPRWRGHRGAEVAIGPGKADLLEGITRLGSISGAAAALGMSYRRAWLLVDTMNRSFVSPLVATTAHRRGGAALTPAGRRVLALYRRIEALSLAVCRVERRALLRLLRAPRRARRGGSRRQPSRRRRPRSA